MYTWYLSSVYDGFRKVSERSEVLNCLRNGRWTLWEEDGGRRQLLRGVENSQLSLRRNLRTDWN